jgi:hypothetical protein
MKKLLLTLLLFGFVIYRGIAQVKEPPPPVTELPNTVVEQQLENITENNEDAETEDDAFLQEMLQFQKNPVNLNTADETQLKALRILSPLQVQSLLTYRQFLGRLINIYEMQALPGWDIATIQRLKPYVTVNTNAIAREAFGERFRDGDNSLLMRATQILEKSLGYLLDSSNAKNFYPGSPQRVFVRYKYNYKNLLQYGVLGEKDAGEQFFKGGQKHGFDFYSAHFFVRNIGIIKSLALGDFTVNMGQGLTQWMSLAFKKGPDVLAIKRQADVLRPYNSSGEIAFHRGAGITLRKNNWEATVFGSYRKIDANFMAADTIQNTEEFISSLQTSGFHRTNSEQDDKGIQRQLAFGGNLNYRYKTLQVGINAIQYSFKYPLIRQSDPYNKYALAGKSFGNYSMDYSYTWRNLHMFGEAATTDKKYPAFVNGLLISVASNVDMSFFYRNISAGYQSLYTSAFTESTFPTNEKGFFSGIVVRPNNAFTINAYVDLYRFPWLRYRVNSPTTGSDYLVQLNYKPNKVLEIYSRFKAEKKGINYNPDALVISPVIPQPKQNWRTQISYKLNPVFTFRSRAEVVWFDKKGPAAENGFMMYADLFYKPIFKPLSANIRLQYFETDNYNSRLYTFESDVLYSFSIPVLYGKGYRYYINLNYDFNKRLSLWAKFGQFIYPNRSAIGSGLDEIAGHHKTDVKMQLLYRF